MNNPQKTFSLRVVVLMLLVVVVFPFLPLLISWRWNWWEAWVYAIISVLGFAVSRMLAGRRNPGLLAERARFMAHKDAKPWDRLLSPLVGLGSVFILLAAGLDASFGGSPAFGLALKILALLIILDGYALSSYALIENRFFSGIVRIQTDRGHHVISGGPYRWIRHPGYAGALLVYLATPIFLDSAWAFVPAALITIILFIRTHLEDSTLQAELEGYADYAKRVRYRLIPGVW